jgi:cell division protein ZapA (FtsZ GTPase activity inhibitor)
MSTITIEVDDEVADLFQLATPADREKLTALVAIMVRGLAKPRRPLAEIMDEIGERAAQRGMTEAKLNKILSEE